MRRRRLSLTQRLVWTLTGAVALFVGLLAVLAFVALHEQEDDLADEQVQGELQQLQHKVASGEIRSPAALQIGARLFAYVVEGAQGLAQMPPAIRPLGPGLHELEREGQTWHVAVAESQGRRMVVVVDATASEARVHQFGLILVLLWVACTGAAAWLARSVAVVVVGPMVDVTRRIASGLPGGGGLPVDRDDEAGMLIEAFNRFQDRVDESINREREFAANLNHEIRTPLTTIRTDAELVALDAGLTPTQQDRLARIMATVDDIVATADATQAIHTPQPDRADRVLLQQCVLDGWLGMADRAAEAGLAFVQQVPDEAARDLDRYALLTVIRNLIRNAIDHAAPATLTVTGDLDRLRFCDNGPGIPAEDLPNVFDRYHRGQRSDDRADDPVDGHHAGAARAVPPRGLGLAIAKRICDVQGWRLTVHSSCAPDDHGTCFLLELPHSA